MRRLQINIFIDIVLLIAMAILSFSGFVIKVVMPGGSMHRRGEFNRITEFLEMTRHSWKDIHLWAGILVVLLIVAHIVLHWKMINLFFQKNTPNAWLRNIFYVILLAVSASTVLPWMFVMI